MSDDYEPAIAGDMEPEAPQGTLDGQSDADEDEPAIGFGEGPAGPSGTVHQRGRAISDKTRELFKTAQKSIREQNASGESPFGAYDEGYTPPVTPAKALVDGAPTARATSAMDTPTTAAPAPSLDPAVQQHRERLAAREAELAKMEESLAQREAASDIHRHRDAYFERGAGALVDLIKSWTGAANDDDIRDEVADLITELSGSVLGVNIEPAIKAKIEAKRATKSVKAQMAAMSEREKRLATQQQQAQDAAAQKRVESILSETIAKPEGVSAYPYLAAEDNAGEIVYEIVQRHHQKTGDTMPWTEAAKQANDYLQQKWSAAYAKRSHLFAAPSGKVQTGNAQRPQGDPQGIRRSHTLNNGAAQQTPPSEPSTPAVVNGKLNNEALRAQTRRKMRAAFRPSED